MAYIVDHVEVRKLIKMKQNNEVKLSHAIYDIFNEEPWVSNIRRTVKAGLGAMLEDNPNYLRNAVKEESRLQVWDNHKAPRSSFGVKLLFYGAESLNASDCADLFRLVGAWVEQHKGSPMALAKEKERVGSGKADGPWQQPKGGERGIRHRENIYEGAKEWTTKRGNVTIDRTPLDVRKQLLLHGQDKHKDHIGVAGRELKRIPKNQSDSVLKIDQFFGLRDICSISGTTADVMYGINVFGKKAGNGYSDLDEIYRVLPFGTIAGFHHHSILEVALPQSLRGYIDYRIGFYKSLAPQNAGNTGLARMIRNTLEIYESVVNQNNLHMICFYENGFPEGAMVLYGPNEISKLRSSPLSQATTLSKKMPVIPNGRLSFSETLNAVQMIDPGFCSWLKNELWAFDRDKFKKVKDTGKVR